MSTECSRRCRSTCERQEQPSAIHEHGDLRVREHLDRLAAEDNRGDTPTPVRGHHDQIAPSRGGGINNRLIDLFVLDVKHLADDIGGFGRSRDGSSWAEAHRRLQQEGRRARVSHPSKAHQWFKIPEPRTSAGRVFK